MTDSYAGITVSPQFQEHLARQYEAAPDFERNALPAFRAMHEETKRQFDYLTRPRAKGGLGVEVGVTSHDPYEHNGEPDPAGMMADARRGRLNVMSSATTGGHPVFGNEGNDMFRAVHDYFGHFKTGRGFDQHGEEAAYQAHARMYSPLARQALATETRGQNAMLHRRGAFPDQKVALLPSGTMRQPTPRNRGALLREARQLHFEHGLGE